jgi:hypothetical protein
MMIEFLQGDAVVARARPELEAPDALGRIAYVGTFETATFEPGRYSVRAVVMQGDASPRAKRRSRSCRRTES